MFADAYRKRRCIVPMTSFNLKDQNGKRRAISRIDSAPFGVAGIWENWKEPITGRWERTFAIITVPANKLIAPIHDRMPAILHKRDFQRWMGPEDDPRDLLIPYADDDLVVSPPAGKSRPRP
jgi:putative SOS response-associated peptidase YedK